MFWKRQKGSLGLVLGLGKGKKVLWAQLQVWQKGQESFLGLVVVLGKGHKGSLWLGVGLGKT